MLHVIPLSTRPNILFGRTDMPTFVLGFRPRPCVCCYPRHRFRRYQFSLMDRKRSSARSLARKSKLTSDYFGMFCFTLCMTSHLAYLV